MENEPSLNWNLIFKDKYITSIFLIVVFKVVFLVSSFFLFLLTHKKDTNIKTLTQIARLEKVKDFFDTLYIISMSILLTYLFYPNKQQITLDAETKLLLYLFGLIMIIETTMNAYENYKTNGNILKSVFESGDTHIINILSSIKNKQTNTTQSTNSN